MLKVHFLLVILLLLFYSNPVIPSTNIVKTLPGFSGSLPFKLQTGYIRVDEKEDVNYFYYFIESERNPRDNPLMLWLSGGPGCSVLSGLAFEIGPLKFKNVEYNGSLPALELNPYSWTKVASIIFLDAPVGTGFSYSKSLEGSQTGDFVYANRCHNFMRKWFLAHPKFNTNSFYLGGDSFSGKIIPIIAEQIAQSVEANNIPKINFKGYLLGNPITDSKIEDNYKVKFAHQLGLVSDELYQSLKKTCKGHYIGQHSNDTLCAKNLEAYSMCIENINLPHILESNCSTFLNNDKLHSQRSLLEKSLKPNLIQLGLNIKNLPPPPEASKFGCWTYKNLLVYYWANDKTVQEALHIQKETIQIWIRCNRSLPYAKDVDSVVSYHKQLNSRGYRALIYSGDHDMVVPYLGTLAWIKSMNLSIVDRWRPWLVDNQVAGYVTEYSKGLFTFTTIKGGGHTAPEFNPKECFAMFERWISQQPL
ncbi:serine carboxypeptidase-like 2 isoform X3 [Cannabis sativa]|uniref:serine carboxypeptidase-like 2 isoform X3 n=1 Tax=Cannabis sativa TaxID=3483 RepID=UPI0029CA0D36|nr:serine carboxypeptidase-like 2 isoform X3 [Cannabis sativa]